MTRKILTVIFSILPLFLFSQTRQIDGYLKDTGGKPIVAVTVMLKNAAQKLISFKDSNEQGYFKFELPETSIDNKLFIEINYLGFKKVKIPANIADINNIVLETQDINLAEIEIKSVAKLSARGDTTKYNVAAFKKPEDRTIGEVISRVPGLEVNAKGQIKFNGRNISSLYINGDNLLDDKYSIGTKSIPADLVKTIEVMQNHQPTRALKGKVLSDNVALNLVIEEEAKTKVINQVMAGLGSPKQYDGELINIAFKDKFKSLNVLKANNTGIDLADDFSAFNFSENLSQLGITRPNAILSLGNAGLPPLPKQRYYFNNSESLNLNNMISLKDSLQLKANINVLADRNTMFYQSQTDNYLPKANFSYTEYQQIVNKDRITEATFTLESNKAKSFVKDDFRFIYRYNNGITNLISNERVINQRLQNQIREFSNRLSFIPSLKNGNLLDLDWNLSHFNRPQALHITPGLNSAALNNNIAFSETKQIVEVPTWLNRLSLSYTFSKHILKHTYQIGILNEFQKLKSDLFLTQLNGAITNSPSSHDNNLLWRRNQFFVAAKFEYKKNRWEASLYSPLTFQLVNYEDTAFDLNRNHHRVLLNPILTTKYYLSAEDFLTFNYSYEDRMSNITGIYPGVIFTNYRSLNSNQADLQQKKVHYASLHINSQRTTKMLFINGGINYIKTLANSITSTIVSNDITKTITLPAVNNVESVGANFGISKYLRFLRSTGNLNIFWNKTQSAQIFNGLRLPFNAVSFSANSNIEAELFKKLRIKYITSFGWSKSYSSALAAYATAGVNEIKISTYENAARFNWSVNKNVNLLFNLRHNYTIHPAVKDLGYLFADATITYSLAKIKTDFEINLVNLTNVKSYQTYMASMNSFWQSNYQLRERMLLAKAIFSF